MATISDAPRSPGKLIQISETEALKLIQDLAGALKVRRDGHRWAPTFAMTAIEQDGEKSYPSVLYFEIE